MKEKITIRFEYSFKYPVYQMRLFEDITAEEADIIENALLLEIKSNKYQDWIISRERRRTV